MLIKIANTSMEVSPQAHASHYVPTPTGTLAPSNRPCSAPLQLSSTGYIDKGAYPQRIPTPSMRGPMEPVPHALCATQKPDKMQVNHCGTHTLVAASPSMRGPL